MRKVNGNKLREICKKKRISQRNLALKSGVGRQEINRIINHDSKVRPKTLLLLATALEIDAEELCLADDTENEESVGNIIERVCIEKGLSYEQLSNMTGVSRTTLHRIINNNYKPSDLILHRIARGLEVDLKTLYPSEVQSIGQQVRQGRIAKNMTQAELADKVGMWRDQISDIERNRIKPQKLTRKRIAAVLEIDL